MPKEIVQSQLTDFDFNMGWAVCQSSALQSSQLFFTHSFRVVISKPDIFSIMILGFFYLK